MHAVDYYIFFIPPLPFPRFGGGPAKRAGEIKERGVTPNARYFMDND